MTVAAGLLCSAGLANANSTDNLADLVTTGGSLTIDNKVFSDFQFKDTGLTSFDASLITVTAYQSGGIDYLAWSGNMSFSSLLAATADLLLQYEVTVTPGGGAINYLDQSYDGSAYNGFLSVDETAAIGTYGGTIVGSSDLNPIVLSETDINITPPELQLYVTKDITFYTDGGGIGADSISLVTQSYHQLPAPDGGLTVAMLGSALIGVAAFRSKFGGKRG